MDPPYVQDPTATKFQGYEPRSVVGYGLRLRAVSCYEKPLSMNVLILSAHVFVSERNLRASARFYVVFIAVLYRLGSSTKN